MKHKNTQPLYIFNRENPQNSEPQNGPRRMQTECRECDQIIIGRNFAYRRALEVIQNEEYVDFIDTDILRKKRDLEVKNTKKYAQLLGSNKKSKTKRQTGEGFVSAAPPECSIIPRCQT